MGKDIFNKDIQILGSLELNNTSVLPGNFLVLDAFKVVSQRTTAEILNDLSIPQTYVPYLNAHSPVDLNTQNITTLGTAALKVIQTDYIDFSISNGDPGWSEGRVWYDTIRNSLTVYDDISETALQVGQENRVRVYNNNSQTIPNGAAVTVSGVRPDGVIEVHLAIASDAVSALNTIGIATHDIEVGTYGWATTTGMVNDVDTGILTEGSALWLSDTVPGGYQTTRPLSPSYEVRMGGVVKAGVTDGIIYAELRIIENDQDNNAFYNGAILEPNEVVVTSNGTTVNCALNSLAANNRLSLITSQNYISVTSGINIDLILGTDEVPIQNWVYIDPVGVITVSTSGFPTGTQYTPVGRFVVQSALSASLYGLYKARAYTDHLQGSNGQGHLTHLNEWVRKRPAVWQNGVVLTETVPEGTPAATINISYTSGVVSQLHDHTFPAYDTAIKPAFIINDFTTPYQLANGLSPAIDEDNTGAAIGNNKYYPLVVWGVVSEETKDCKLFFNVPGGSYTNVTDAINDPDSHADYTIPVEYLGTGFLITKFVVKRTNTTVTVEPGGTIDLRGSIPAVGGGSAVGGGGVTLYDSLIDTPVTKVGSSLKAIRVNVGETAHEYYDAGLLYMPIGQQLAQTKALVAGEFFTSYNATTGLFTSAIPSYFTPSSLLIDYGFTDNSTNWDIAFGWGDHSVEGYLQTLTWNGVTNNLAISGGNSQTINNFTGLVTDGLTVNTNEATFNGDTRIGSALFMTLFAPVSGRNLISIGQNGGQTYTITDNSNNWNTAHGWGDHSLAGYLLNTTDTLTGDLTVTGNVNANRLVLNSVSDASLPSTLHALQIGPTSGYNVIFDNNEIQSRNNGAAADLYLQTEGGNLGIFDNTPGVLTINGDTIVLANITADAHITEGGTASQFVKGDGTLDPTSYATTAGIGSETEEEFNFVGGETTWVLSGTPSASFPHRLYAGTTTGGGLILLDEGVDYTLVGSTITYLSPVLPIDPDEKHIIQYNTATVPLTYPTPYADLIYRNADMWEAVDSSAYYFKDRYTYDQRNLQLFIMTDIHGDVNKMNNGITLMNQFDTIDGGLNMGDTCLDTWLDDYTFVDPYHTIGKPVLISIGNHDEGLYRTVANTGSNAQSYARFIQPYETNIGGVHAGKSYYYKDWSSYKIRTINLYDMDDNDDIDPGDPLLYRIFKTHRIWSQAQLDWLAATLTSTPTDYAVIVISHYPIEDQPNITVDYTCKLTDPTIVNWDAEANYVVGNPIADMMEAWINGTTSGALSYATSGSTGEAAYKPNLTVNVDFTSRGAGHFITYLCGHVHQDGVGTLTGYTTQTIITINCTTDDKNRNKYGSTQRKPGTRSEDLLTTMAFDTVNRQIKVVRLGAQLFTEGMKKMDYTIIDY